MSKTESKKIDPQMWLFNFVKATAAFPILFSERLKKVYLTGKKPKGLLKGRLIVCANHRSYWDPVIICNLFWNRRVQFIATKELFGNKVSNWFFNHVGAIMIDRTDIGVKTFKAAKRSLDKGRIVTIFPEASVSAQQSIRAFNPGAALMSILCEADVLPVYIVPREKSWKRRVVVIGERINPKQFIQGKLPTLNEIQHITNVIRQQELKLKEVYDSWQK